MMRWKKYYSFLFDVVGKVLKKNNNNLENAQIILKKIELKQLKIGLMLNLVLEKKY